MGSWLEALILTSRDGASVGAFLSWSIPPDIWFLPPASYNAHAHIALNAKFDELLLNENQMYSIMQPPNTRNNLNVHSSQFSLLISDLWRDLLREALFASEPFLFLPLLQCQAKDARVHLLGCNIRFKGKKYFLTTKLTPQWRSNISLMTNMRKNLSKLCDLSYSRCQTATCDGGHWNKMFLIDKQELSISGDTNLIVCYLDAGRPMRWSYLRDRCSTPLHLQSQPAPSLQAVDLNSSESTQ